MVPCHGLDVRFDALLVTNYITDYVSALVWVSEFRLNLKVTGSPLEIPLVSVDISGEESAGIVREGRRWRTDLQAT